jgi:hypothetical protein
MEALAAVSIAGNIVQFVEFGLRVLCKTREIYRSTDDCLAENQDLEIVTNDLVILQRKLQASRNSTNNPDSMPEHDKDLESLNHACAELAGNLLEKLNMAKAQGRFRRWKSLRQAVKSVWSKSEVDAMARRLESFRSQLQMRILISLKCANLHSVSTCSLTFSRSNIDLESIDLTNITNNLDQSTQRVVVALRENRDIFDVTLKEQVRKLQRRLDISDSLTQKTGDEIKHTILTVVQRDEQLNKHTGSASDLDLVEKVILKTLHYEGMHDRYEAVVEAHANTFTWIFHPKPDQPWDSFSDWLERGEEIYWITGKAASGKSTLMRYIFANRTLRDHLRVWRGDSRLIVAKFYFWGLGASIQRSQIGLFRSLLYQIFYEYKELVRDSMPNLFTDLACLSEARNTEMLNFPPPRRWLLSELKATLYGLLQKTSISIKYCFLIDGLDEFDGDHLELACFFKEISAFPNVKLCLSSRPLMAFEQELGIYPKLRLQDLTEGDIRRFVHDKLQGHPRFQVLALEEEQSSADLINEIFQMSSGVFLWVDLVIKSLLKGLTNYDTVCDLRRRLKEVPPELDDLYRLMLQSICPAFYRVQGSKLLQLVYQSPKSMSPTELSFADDDDPDLALKTRIEEFTEVQLRQRADLIIPKIISRCVGLLEVSNARRFGDTKRFPADRYVKLSLSSVTMIYI